MTRWLEHPWAVFGDLCTDDDNGSGTGETGSLQVAVAEVGILPPAGRYVGEVTVDGGEPLFTGFTVPPRPEVWATERCITVDLRQRQLASAGAQVAVRFQGIELAAPAVIAQVTRHNWRSGGRNRTPSARVTTSRGRRSGAPRSGRRQCRSGRRW